MQRFLEGLGIMRPAGSALHLAVRACLAFVIHAVLDWIDQEANITRGELCELFIKTLEAAILACGLKKMP